MQKSLKQAFVHALIRWRVVLTVISLGSFVLLSAQTASSQHLQQVRISAVFENESLASCIKKLEKNYHLSFGYDQQQLADVKISRLRFVNETLHKVMNGLLANTSLTFEEKNGVIILSLAPAAMQLQAAQTMPGKIRGRCLESGSANPIPGVTVRITGTNYTAITDADGIFELSVPHGTYTVQFSSIGYQQLLKPAVRVAAALISLPVNMDVQSSRLSEAVVIGYGVQERRQLLGAVSTFRADEQRGQLPISVDQAMVGKLPGVYIAPSSGVPGAASNITIRGISTLNPNGNTPLIVVDGVPIYGIDQSLNTVDYSKGSSQGFSYGGTQVANDYSPRTTFEKNPLATLNPDDIASIEVLKDAYATAIYGSRGSGGVILITTRKGRKGTAHVDVQVSSSISTPRKLPGVMTGDQYADFYNRLFQLKDSIGKASSGWYIPTNYKFPKGVNTNWLDEVVRNAIGTDANVSMSGGTDKSNYYVSLGYNKQEAYIINNDFTRYQGRVNFDNQLTKALKVGVSVGLNQANNNALNAQQVYRDAILKAPNIGIYDSVGKFNWRYGNNPTGPETVSNPVGQATTGKNYSTDSRVLGNVFADLKLLSWLTVHADVGTDWINSRAYSRVIDRPQTVGGMATETQQQLRKMVVNNRVDINKLLEGGHGISAMLGQSFEKSVEDVTTVVGDQFINDEMLSIATAKNKRVVTSLQQEWAQVSFLGRLNYQYKNQYLAGVTYRLDGSSRFSRNHRYVGFPSFALGWVPSEAAFLKGNAWLNQLKLRGSVGFTGSDGGNGYYGNQGQYVVNTYGASYGTVTAIGTSQPANPNLAWERTTTWNIGLDLGVFNSAVTATLDYYRRQTTNAIVSSALPYFQGFSVQKQNLADLTNTGLELSISSENIKGKSLTWNTNFNISANRNKVVRLHKINEDELAVQNEQDGGRFWKVGHSATAYYLYQWGGINPQNGQPLWIDKSGKSSETPIQQQYTDKPYLQREYKGDAMPVVFGGLGNTVSWKSFELNCFFSFSAGNKIINGAKAAQYSYMGSSASSNNTWNLSPELLAYWQYAGQNTDIPALINKSNYASGSFGASYDYTLSRQSDRFLEDASFIKLRSLTLTYDFTRMLKSVKSLRSLRVFVEGNNLFVLTGYSGIDPEVSANGSSALGMGFDELTMAAPRTWRIGVKASL
ncbi:SusC/RagA family TonB-linked outer membrane protein [Chitinophaga sp. sic0106]|uniref:SusC/RagA family TonB-linked outer membrane protein n=1 Tax=Chitinophaga sp. sic0106 TaxID=2854785 RepID=UPI001C45A260|nr:SusC/RagA family TonB-linked outer membrane protein [Chitinophaga sp. sic0106]MBV7533982.1 SusC/RagA family TonB-linked outer membrane protein [Chitinophaga sp. sic0106]